MKIQDYEQLIYESLLYPDYAKADFFRKKQEESGFSKIVFTRGLIEAFSIIVDYLNSRPSDVLSPDVYNAINLYLATGGKMTGTIYRDSPELSKIFEAIKELTGEVTEQKTKELPEKRLTETEPGQKTIELKPVLKPEAVQVVFDIIKDYFPPEQQAELKQVLETGNNANNKLLFEDNGNRLTDTFKKLYEHNFITGCQKKDLINWITRNFSFIHRGKINDFILGTVERTISRNNSPCRWPLIEIKNGQILKAEQPRIKKSNW